MADIILFCLNKLKIKHYKGQSDILDGTNELRHHIIIINYMKKIDIYYAVFFFFPSVILHYLTLTSILSERKMTARVIKM